jgi:hypothetical protein
MKLYELNDTSYELCRWDYNFTEYVIHMVSKIVEDDLDLKNFLLDCEQNVNDPRCNPFFNKHKWPDLNIKTEDDTKEQYDMAHELKLGIEIISKFILSYI